MPLTQAISIYRLGRLGDKEVTQTRYPLCKGNYRMIFHSYVCRASKTVAIFYKLKVIGGVGRSVSVYYYYNLVNDQFRRLFSK